MWLRISNILSFLFPRTDDELCILSHTEATFKKLYQCKNVNGVYALSSFKEKPIRAAIHLNKFHNHTDAQRLLGALLETFLENRTSKEPAILIPVPLSPKRERERGYNQVTAILERTPFSKQHYTLEEKLLQKIRDTKPQTTLSKTERIKNTQGVYTASAHARTRVFGAHILLIDDVVTTGATLRDAKRALEKLKPASINCVALAH